MHTKCYFFTSHNNAFNERKNIKLKYRVFFVVAGKAHSERTRFAGPQRQQSWLRGGRIRRPPPRLRRSAPRLRGGGRHAAPAAPAGLPAALFPTALPSSTQSAASATPRLPRRPLRRHFYVTSLQPAGIEAARWRSESHACGKSVRHDKLYNFISKRTIRLHFDVADGKSSYVKI